MKRLSILTLSFLATAGIAQPVNYLGAGVTFQENFDRLPSSGVNAFTNGQTVSGLYAFNGYLGTPGGDAATIISATSGNQVHGGFFSLGQAGSTERAFGSIAGGNNTNGSSVFGLALRNSTGSTLTEFRLSYWGEQWSITTTRSGISFGYLISDGPLFTAANSAYSPVSALDFVTPDWGAFGPVNGNAPQFRTRQSARITGIVWRPNDVLNLRWLDTVLPVAESAVGIDDLEFEAVPEPTTISLLVAASPLLFRKRKNRAS